MAVLISKAQIDRRGIGELLLIHIRACHEISCSLINRGVQAGKTRPSAVDPIFPLVLDAVTAKIFWGGGTNPSLTAAPTTIPVKAAEAPDSTAPAGASTVHVTLRAV